MVNSFKSLSCKTIIAIGEPMRIFLVRGAPLVILRYVTSHLPSSTLSFSPAFRSTALFMSRLKFPLRLRPGLWLKLLSVLLVIFQSFQPRCVCVWLRFNSQAASFLSHQMKKQNNTFQSTLLPVVLLLSVIYNQTEIKHNDMSCIQSPCHLVYWSSTSFTVVSWRPASPASFATNVMGIACFICRSRSCKSVTCFNAQKRSEPYFFYLCAIKHRADRSKPRYALSTIFTAEIILIPIRLRISYDNPGLSLELNATNHKIRGFDIPLKKSYATRDLPGAPSVAH